jgi:hypothetical protein
VALEKSSLADLDENLKIALAVKVMVKVKNLFRQKDGLGPCFGDAEVKPQLSVHNKLRYQIRHLYYGMEAI